MWPGSCEGESSEAARGEKVGRSQEPGKARESKVTRPKKAWQIREAEG